MTHVFEHVISIRKQVSVRKFGFIIAHNKNDIRQRVRVALINSMYLLSPSVFISGQSSSSDSCWFGIGFESWLDEDDFGEDSEVDGSFDGGFGVGVSFDVTGGA